MQRRQAVLFLYFFVLVSFFKGYKQTNTKSTNSAAEEEHKLIRHRRNFGSEGPPCNMLHGVYLERWDRIDYKRVKFLLADPRYPTLPSLSLCVPTFEQPQKWADFFGARMRTYFVPIQTGDHYFYLSSDAGSELYLSKDETAAGKTMICEVDGGFPSEPYEYDRYSTQKSLPIHLEKEKFYYMESIMKDDHQYDHLEVALQTPDGTFYNVIPSTFLWTIFRKSYERNATYQALLLKIAAEAGAKAGLSFGERFAMRSGARAGAKAGAKAGMHTGASAGAIAGVNAAIQMTTTALEDALNTLHGDSTHKFKINVEDGEVVSVTGPGMESSSQAAAGAASAATGSVGAAGEARTAASAAAAAGAASAGAALGTANGSQGSGNQSLGVGGGAGVGAGGAGRGGGGGGGGGRGGGVVAGGAASSVGAGGGGLTGGTGSSTSGGGSAGAAAGTAGGGAAGGGAGGGATVGGQSVVTGSSQGTSNIGGGGGGAGEGGGESYTSLSGRDVVNYGGKSITELTYEPKPGENAQDMARQKVWRAGGARIIVANAMYTIHSYNIPYAQENFTLNQCWRSDIGKLVLDQWCNVFITRIPSLSPKAGTPSHTVSFESVCFPGYFLRQKNFHFLLQKRDGSDVFDRDSSFHIFDVMRYARNFLFHSTHDDWYICQSAKRKKFGTEVILDYYNGEPDVLDRCTFILNPILDNKLRYCKNALGPVKAPEINGQPFPHPPDLVPHTPAPPIVLPSCIPFCPPGKTEAVTQSASGTGTSAVAIPSISSTATSSKKMCVALKVTNMFGSAFKLFSSLKSEGYFVTGSGFKLKLIVDRPMLHRRLRFYAEDPQKRREILLNGNPALSEPVLFGCPEFVDVVVSPGKALLPANTTQISPVLPKVVAPPSLPTAPATVSPPAPKASSTQAPLVSPSPPKTQASTSSSPSDNGTVHFHYHYHGRKTPVPVNVCPSSCIDTGQCHPLCPIHCCTS